jgi:PhnB protein
MAGATPNPQQRHTLTPGLVVRNCAQAIEFYKRALGAVELMRMNSPDGKGVWHAELRIGDSVFFMADEMPAMGRPAPSAEHPCPVTMWLSADDCDASYDRAVKAGASSTMEPADMFWGDRCAGVTDPYGYAWSFAEHQKDLTEEEMRRAGEEFARNWRPPAGMQADASSSAG